MANGLTTVLWLGEKVLVNAGSKGAQISIFTNGTVRPCAERTSAKGKEPVIKCINTLSEKGITQKVLEATPFGQTKELSGLEAGTKEQVKLLFAI